MSSLPSMRAHDTYAEQGGLAGYLLEPPPPKIQIKELSFSLAPPAAPKFPLKMIGMSPIIVIGEAY